MSCREYDAVVVGLGPAGSTAVRLLGEKGLRVLGIDRVQFPRWKPCGGGLSARAIPLLPSGWEKVPYVLTTGVQVTMGDSLFQSVDMGVPIAYQFHRDQLDYFLFEKAKGEGAEIETGSSLEDLAYEEGIGFTLLIDGANIKTKRLIAADGITSQVKRLLFGSPREFRRIPRGSGKNSSGHSGWPSSELLGKAAEPTDDRYVLIDIGSVPGGYAWSFPKDGPGKALGVAGLLNPLPSPVRTLRDFLKSFRGEKEDPSDGEVSTWVIPSWQSVKEHGTIEGLFLVGDAGGIVDPFLGEGIYYAILSASKAVQAIVAENDPGKASESYSNWVRQDMFRDFAQASRLSAVIYRFPAIYYRLISSYPQLLTLFSQIMTGRHDYRSFSRAAGIKLLRLPFKKFIPSLRTGRRFF
ncbi:MAG: NAD(P)/FAD-dependent oxidoreductase [Nitrospiraceae bacterium]|nr:NAD(P)/FAD-dependent oxidoreductase [Nitrospiraceae bacterium]